MLDVNLQSLEYIVEVGKTASISRAAENLFVSQPRLSTVIREVEKKYNITLFIRSRKGMELTDVGKTFVRQAQAILTQARHLDSSFRTDSEKGVNITISVTRSYQVTKRVAEFINRHHGDEQFQLRFKETNPFTVLESVRFGESDFGILHYFDAQANYFKDAYKKYNFETRRFYDRQFLVAMSRSNPLASAERITQDMLGGQTMVIYGDYEAPTASYDEVVQLTDIFMSTKRVYVYDRGGAMDLLSLCPDTYTWITGLNPTTLKQYNLVLRKCEDVLVRNLGEFVYPPLEQLSPACRELFNSLIAIDWTELIV